MPKILVAGWDHDKVMVPDFGTSYLALGSKLDPNQYLERFKKEGLFTQEDADRWIRENREIRSVKDIADCLSDFMYSYKILDREQLVYTKNTVLAGLSIRNIKEICSSIPYSEGFSEAFDMFRMNKILQTLFSDTNGIIIDYHIRKLGFAAGKGVPPLIEVDGREVVYSPAYFDVESAKLTGKMERFDKSKAFFDYLKEKNHPLNVVAVIDDSGANVESLLLPVKQAGGIAVGYNPTDAHRPTFQKYSVPILKGRHLRAFAEIVLDPRESTIGRYCE